MFKEMVAVDDKKDFLCLFISLHKDAGYIDNSKHADSFFFLW